MPDESESQETRVRWRGEPDVREETCLVLIYGPGLGAKIPIETDEVTIGRDTDRSDLSIPVDDVSRAHCSILRMRQGYVVRDLGSTNGTRVNDQRIPEGEEAPLRSGDHLHLGGVIFKFLDGCNVETLYHEEIYRMAIEDGLTELHNQRYLMDFLDREMARARRHGSPLSLLLFDLDHFKQVNDQHGHLAGDDVLREVGKLLRGVMRRECCLARYGGEEFAVVLPETDIPNARIFAERIRGSIEVHRFEVGGKEIPVTISVGVAQLKPGMLQPSQFIGAADTNLYEAKQAGRNRVSG